MSPDAKTSPNKETNETPGLPDNYFETHKIISPEILSPLSSNLEASVTPGVNNFKAENRDKK